MAGCYRYLGPKQRFRAIAYEGAARTMQGLKEDVSIYGGDVKALDKLSGIGESIAEKIAEYISNGEIRAYEQLKAKVPEGLLELMDITGVGPSTVKMLHKRLGINNKADFINALQNDKLKGVRGFAEKKIENLKRGLALYAEKQERMLLSTALEIGNNLLANIKEIKDVIKAELAGSLRRRKETIGDIDIVACAKLKNSKAIIEQILKMPEIERVLAKGETKLSFLLKQQHAQVDIRIVKEKEYGAALLYFTGSREHSIKLRTWAKAQGWKVSEYGVYNAATEKRIAGATEEEIYECFDMQYIPPELREEHGEIELSRSHKLPRLVTTDNIKGDLQMHSKWSDGAEEIKTIADYVLREFPKYEYIVITDHSPSERVAGGLQTTDFKKQFKEIDALNKKSGNSFIKKGVEVDILANGELDLPDSLLKQFDWVVASIHTGFNRDNTDRLIKACYSPYVHCIGHPAGRLIGKRPAYPVDWKKLFKTLVETGTAIEINAQPDRLDLKDDLVREAISQGVTITISTDAHMLSQLDFMELGIAVARRGWCTKRNILNTQTWKGIEAFKLQKSELVKSVQPI